MPQDEETQAQRYRLNKLLENYSGILGQSGPVTANSNMLAQGKRMGILRQEWANAPGVMSPMHDQWLNQQRDNVVMDLASNLLPLAPAAGRGLLALGKSVAPQAGQAAGNYMNRMGLLSPINTWHGTPHTLPPTPANPLGQFDLAKIGTGEGAQAYGHGVYLAENKGVAGSYKDKLSPDTITRVKNDVYNIAGDDNHILTIYDANGKATKTPFLSPDELEKWVGKDAADMLRAKGDGDYKGLNIDFGNLYKVDLPDEHIAKMLDWDKPLSQQSAEAQTLVQKAIAIRKQQTGTDLTVRPDSSVKDLLGTIGEDRLKAAGFPGIKYLDGGSRAAGEGSRNFVVFDPKIANILERNGMTGNK